MSIQNSNHSDHTKVRPTPGQLNQSRVSIKTTLTTSSSLPDEFFDPKWAWYLLAVLIYFMVYYMPVEKFSEPGKHALAVFSVAAYFWITNVFPIAVTGIIVLLLLPLSDGISSENIYSYFGNDAVFFVLGAFILASPVMRSGLSTRIAITIMALFGKGNKRLLLSIFLLAGFSAFIISEHAVAAMLFPIIMEIIKASGCKKGDRFAFIAFVIMAWGAMIGGTATLLGGARAPLAIGMLTSETDHTISFVEWTLWTLPTVLTIFLLGSVIILFMARNTTFNIEAARQKLYKHKAQLGTFSMRERYTITVLLGTIILWVGFGTKWGLDWIALLGVIAAFCLRITNWEEVEKDVKWGIFVMYGSAIALSVTLKDTGAANDLVELLISTGITSPLLVFFILAITAFILTEIMSNAAAVAVLLPIGLALGPEYGIDPRAIALTIATCAGLTYLLPVSTPAMAIVTSCNYVSMEKAMFWGLLMKLISFVIFIMMALFYWPYVGLSITTI